MKPIDEFHLNGKSRDGHRAECKVCACQRASEANPRLGPRLVKVDACGWCGQPFAYTRTRGPARRFCCEECRYRSGEATKRANAPIITRTCACGSSDVAKVGKPVCPGCKKSRRNPEREYAKERRRTLRRYGITQEEYDLLCEAQGYRCAICRTETPGGRGELWHIDHDHSTGKVRGLLCHNCNVGLGNFHDDVGVLTEAIRYLEQAKLKLEYRETA